jgi:hypothetical protein
MSLHDQQTLPGVAEHALVATVDAISEACDCGPEDEAMAAEFDLDTPRPQVWRVSTAGWSDTTAGLSVYACDLCALPLIAAFGTAEVARLPNR